jgi:glycerol-3-phosphate cytidylyltransferase
MVRIMAISNEEAENQVAANVRRFLPDQTSESTDQRSESNGLVGYVPGVFDMFHIGHLNILRRSSERCDWLIVGVVSDDVVEKMKGHRPIVPLAERIEIVASNRYVDEVLEDKSADKREAWSQRPFDVIFKGSDWKNTPKGERLEEQMGSIGVRVEYLPYTAHTSSSLLRDTLTRLANSLPR